MAFVFLIGILGALFAAIEVLNAEAATIDGSNVGANKINTPSAVGSLLDVNNTLYV